MRLLHVSDVHLDARFAWADAPLARKRRQAQRETLRRVAALAEELRPDAVLCGGDLYEHDRLAPDTGEFLRALLEHLHPIPVYIAPGNHDWCGADSPYRRLRWSPNVHVFTGDRLEPVPLADGITLWGAAHLAPTTPRGFLDGFAVDREGVHLALFHGSERGTLAFEGADKAPHAPFAAEQLEQAGLHHAFLGHYHRPRDAARHTYPGNPDPLAFGEDGERGVVLATCLPDGTIVRERRVVATSSVGDVVVDVTGCVHRQEIVERAAVALASLSGCVRLTLQGEVEPTVDVRGDDLRRDTLAPHLDGLVVRLQVRPAYDIPAIAVEPTVRGQFVRDVTAADLPEDERRRVLVVGLRAFEARDDLEVA